MRLCRENRWEENRGFNAGVVHRLECLLAKEKVEGSIPFARSKIKIPFKTGFFGIIKLTAGSSNGRTLAFGARYSWSESKPRSTLRVNPLA